MFTPPQEGLINAISNTVEVFFCRGTPYDTSCVSLSIRSGDQASATSRRKPDDETRCEEFQQ